MSQTSQDLIMFIRHGEKPEAGEGAGITGTGSPDVGALTIRGWTRAGALAVFFGDERFTLPQGLARPNAIYAARPKHGGKGLRASETVTPLAAKLGFTVDETYGTGEEHALAAELSSRRGVTVVAWEHTAIVDILAALGPITPAAPAQWPDRYDLVWSVARTEKGWSFAQIPQLLLADDSAG